MAHASFQHPCAHSVRKDDPSHRNVFGPPRKLLGEDTDYFYDLYGYST